MKTQLIITFPSEKLRHIFATWLSDGGGEQQFFDAVENEMGACNLVLQYHPVHEAFPIGDKLRYGQFLEDNTIRVIEA